MIHQFQFGIKLKITLAFSLVFISLSFLFNFYGYREIRKMLINDNNQFQLSQATGLLNKTDISPVIIPLPGAKSAIRVLKLYGGQRIQVFESPGMIRNIRTPFTTGVTDTLGMRLTYVESNNEDNPAALMLVTSGERLNDNLQYLWILLFVCSLCSVIVASIIAYFLASYLLYPVQQIINKAKIINTNKLRDMISVKETNDELQELTETINSMLLRIDESLQQQQNFFASASHELKTPLAILRAELETNLKRDTLNPQIKALLNSQLTEINRLQQLVQEFLLISQLKGGELLLYKEPVDISVLTIRIFTRLKPLMDEKNLSSAIEFNKETESFAVDADDDKIGVALANIIENAIKYSVDHGMISCAVQKTPDQYLLITISNEIPQTCIPTEKLGQAYYRTDTQHSGAGLGLWLASQIVDLHGGSIQLASANHCFQASIYLPFQQP